MDLLHKKLAQKRATEDRVLEFIEICTTEYQGGSVFNEWVKPCLEPFVGDNDKLLDELLAQLPLIHAYAFRPDILGIMEKSAMFTTVSQEDTEKFFSTVHHYCPFLQYSQRPLMLPFASKVNLILWICEGLGYDEWCTDTTTKEYFDYCLTQAFPDRESPKREAIVELVNFIKPGTLPTNSSYGLF